MERPKFRLLIVEDNPDDAFLLIRELKRAGYDIDHHVVCRETDLRHALVHNRWDCVTSDHKMPEFTAHEAVKVVRELAPDLPMVIVSGELDLDLAVGLLKCGADDYVHKNELPLVVNAIEAAKSRSEMRVSLKQERKQILEKERILRSYFDLPVVGAAILTPELKIREINPYLASLVGYDASSLIGDDFPKLADSASDRIVGLLGKLAEGALASIETEAELEHRNGYPIQVHLSANCYYGSDGAPDYIMCVIVDRSKEALLRRQAEESAHLIDSISKTAPMAFYLLNCKTLAFEYSSDKIGECVGTSREEIAQLGGSLWPKALHPKDFLLVPRFVRRLSRLLDGKSLVVRFRMRCADGKYRTYLSESTVYTRDDDGVPLVAFGVLIDETEHVRTETLLSDISRKYSKLVDASQIGIVSTTSDSTIRFVNPAFCRMLGYEASELVGKNARDITHEAYVLKTKQVVDALNKGSGKSISVQKAYVRKNGTICWARTTVIKNVLSDEVELVAMVQDITQEIEALTRAQESEERLSKTFELCPEPMMLLDVTNRSISEVNDVFVEVVGLEKQFVHGLTINDFAQAVEDREFGKLLMDCIEGKTIREDSYELHGGNGGQLWLYPSYTQFDACSKRLCLVLLIDNTELIQSRIKNHKP